MKSGDNTLVGLRHFIGVIENRNDPEKLGRVQVRIYSIHSHNKSDVPTASLPWAMVLSPTTSPALSGIGRSPTGMIEGTWVFGLFLDETEYQQPLVLGSLTGKPSQEVSNLIDPAQQQAFADPNGNYPSYDPLITDIGESSVTRLARTEDAEDHGHLLNKRSAKEKFGEVETAVGSKVSSILVDKDDKYYTRTKWKEPHPRFGGQSEEYPAGVSQSTYPLNHANFTESGHVLEVDDTPGGERLHMYHKKGSFVEYQPDGSRVSKVVGKDYEIGIDGKDVYIKGEVNVTIDGDVRLLIKGDKIEEIGGNYFLTVGKDYIKKVAGNEAKEILSDQAIQINGSKSERISKDYTHTTIGNVTKAIKGTFTKTTTGEEKRTNLSSMTSLLPDNYTLLGSGSLNIAAGTNLTLAAGGLLTLSSIGNMLIETSNAQTITANGTQTMVIGGAQTINALSTTINNNVNVTGTVNASIEVKAAAVTLTGHTHTETGSTTSAGAG
jgi:hypothetical protein